MSIAGAFRGSAKDKRFEMAFEVCAFAFEILCIFIKPSYTGRVYHSAMMVASDLVECLYCFVFSVLFVWGL